MASSQRIVFTHRCAIPALRTALEMAFTAVHSELSSVVSSPVPLAFLPSSITNRVMVTTLVSKAPWSVMVTDALLQQERVEVAGNAAGLKCSATRNCGRGENTTSQSRAAREVWLYLETLPALYTL